MSVSNGRSLCGKCPPSSLHATWLRSATDFLLLYVVGVLELLRQVVKAVPTVEESSIPIAGGLLVDGQKPVVIISGATSGIGKELYHHFRQADLSIVNLIHSAHGKSHLDARSTKDDIPVDFSSLRSTEFAANLLNERIKSLESSQPVLFFHCAGAYRPECHGSPEYSITCAERTLHINTFFPIHFIQLTEHILSGVVYIASASHRVAPEIPRDACLIHAAKTPFSAYPLSKLLTLIWLQEWMIRSGKPVLAVHPGIVATSFYKGERGFVGGALRSVLPILAWSPKTSVSRIMTLLNSSQIFKNSLSSRHTKRNEESVYRDVVTMKHGHVPLNLLQDDERKRTVWKIEEHLLRWRSSGCFT